MFRVVIGTIVALVVFTCLAYLGLAYILDTRMSTRPLQDILPVTKVPEVWPEHPPELEMKWY